MKRFALAASLALLSATAHAGTYGVEGVTVRVQDGCVSFRCVAVNAPGYGYYDGASNRGGRFTKQHRAHKDQTRFASAKSDGTTAPAAPNTVTSPAGAPEKTLDTASQPSDPAPAK